MRFCAILVFAPVSKPIALQWLGCSKTYSAYLRSSLNLPSLESLLLLPVELTEARDELSFSGTKTEEVQHSAKELREAAPNALNLAHKQAVALSNCHKLKPRQLRPAHLARAQLSGLQTAALLCNSVIHPRATNSAAPTRPVRLCPSIGFHPPARLGRFRLVVRSRYRAQRTSGRLLPNKRCGPAPLEVGVEARW